MLNYRIDGSPFVYIIFQASSGRELDQNNGLPSILHFNIFEHASPLGIPSKKECPAHFLNFFLPQIGEIILEDMSEVLGVGSFWRNLHFLTFYKPILVESFQINSTEHASTSS